MLYLSLACKLLKYVSGDQSPQIVESIAFSFKILVLYSIVSVASIIIGLKLLMMSNGPSQVLLIIIIAVAFSSLTIMLLIWWGQQFEKLASFRK